MTHSVESEERPGRSADGSCDLGWALTTVLRAYVRAADRALGELPGGTRAYRLLVAVAEDDLPNQLALAQHVGLDRTVVTYLVDDLVAEGLVERRPDLTDRRSKRVVMTRPGLDRLAHFKRQLHNVEAEVLHSLADTDVVQLRGLLHRVAQQASAGPISCNDVAVLAGELEQPR